MGTIRCSICINICAATLWHVFQNGSRASSDVFARAAKLIRWIPRRGRDAGCADRLTLQATNPCILPFSGSPLPLPPHSVSYEKPEHSAIRARSNNKESKRKLIPRVSHGQRFADEERGRSGIGRISALQVPLSRIATHTHRYARGRWRAPIRLIDLGRLSLG